MVCYGVWSMRKGKGKGRKGKKVGKGKLSAALLWQSRICIPCVNRVKWREVNPLQRAEQFQDKRFCWAESTSVTLLSHLPRSAVISSWISRKPHCNHSIEYYPGFFFFIPLCAKMHEDLSGLSYRDLQFWGLQAKVFPSQSKQNKTKKLFPLKSVCPPASCWDFMSPVLPHFINSLHNPDPAELWLQWQITVLYN